MINIQGLQKVVDNMTVVDIEKLNIEPGEIAAVVGPVGSGKAQLLKLLVGQSDPTMGTIDIGGINPVRDPKGFSKTVGVIFAEDGLYTRQSASQNLNFHAQLHHIPKPRVDEVLSLVGLKDHADQRVEKLSSGLARRLTFGRALLHEPKIILAADPFTRCDESTIHLLIGVLRQTAEEGAPIFIITSDSSHLDEFCDTIYSLNQGRIVGRYQPQKEQEPSLPFRIPVRLDGKVALINPVDILYADAEGGKAALHTPEGDFPTQFTLSELEDRLTRSGFFRTHRSYLVNLQHVKEVIPYTRNSFSLRLDDTENTIIPLSKTAAADLKELLGY